MRWNAWRFHARNAEMHDRSSIPSPEPTVDPLTEMLLGLRVEGICYGRRHLEGAWAFWFPAQSDAYFHFAGTAACWLQRNGQDWMKVEAGSAILLPRGEAHVLASEPTARQNALSTWQPNAAWESGFVSDREGCVLFSGSLRFNLGARHPVLALLPAVMHAGAASPGDDSILPLLEAMGREIAANRAGACGMVARLADVVAAQVIRAWAESGGGAETGWLAAIRHPLLGRVLAAIHAAPDRDWSVEELARLMGASRSSFAEKFTAILGVPPARYIAQVRMHRAQEMLAAGNARLAEVAERLGYESEASFSRAFKRIIGVAPSHHRRAAVCSTDALSPT